MAAMAANDNKIHLLQIGHIVHLLRWMPQNNMLIVFAHI
jgi:hypothetical protein